MLLAANIVVSGGTITYSLKSLDTSLLLTPAIINFLIFVNVVIAMEYCFRRRAKANNIAAKMENKYKLTGNTAQKLEVWTPRMIDKQVEMGQPLMILDNLVLHSRGFET